MKKLLLVFACFVMAAMVFFPDQPAAAVISGLSDEEIYLDPFMPVLSDGEYFNLLTFVSPSNTSQYIDVYEGLNNYVQVIPLDDCRGFGVRLYFGSRGNLFINDGDRFKLSFNLECEPVVASGSVALGSPVYTSSVYFDGKELYTLDFPTDGYLKMDFTPAYVYPGAFVQMNFDVAKSGTGALSAVRVIYDSFKLDIEKSASNAQKETNSLIGQILDGITGLPGKIADLILGGIKDLFIPSDDWFEQSFNEWDTYFEERLGVLYMPVLVAESVIYPLFQGQPLGSAGGLPFDTSGAESLSSGQILFPALSLPIAGETYQIWEAHVIDFAGMLSDYGLSWILTAINMILGYIIVCRFCASICVVMFTTYFKDDLFWLTLAYWFNKISFSNEDKIAF